MVTIGISEMAIFGLKNVAKKFGKIFGKQWFLTIFAKFRTIWIWQPWLEAFANFVIVVRKIHPAWNEGMPLSMLLQREAQSFFLVFTEIRN